MFVWTHARQDALSSNHHFRAHRESGHLPYRKSTVAASSPFLIGIFEATNIDRRVKDDYEPQRPLTHDLVVGVAQSLGATVESVIISELSHSTYFAKLRLRKEDGELVEVDSRPSDAIAVAVTFTPPLPIYVNEQVLQEATSTI